MDLEFGIFGGFGWVSSLVFVLVNLGLEEFEAVESALFLGQTQH